MRTMRVSVLAAVVVLLSTGLALGQDKDKLPKAEELVEKSIKAQGGRAAFEKIKTRVAKGTFEIEGQKLSGPMTVYSAAPNKQYTVIEMEGMGKIESGTDGEIVWELTAMTGPRLRTGDEREMALREADLQSPLNWKKYYKSAETVGVEKTDKGVQYKVLFTPKAGEPETFYFDEKTGLPVKMEFVLKGPMGEVPIVVTMEDYKEIDGLQIATTSRQILAGGAQTMKFHLDEVKHNVDVPADRFAVPAAVKELAEKEKGAPTTGKSADEKKPATEKKPEDGKKPADEKKPEEGQKKP